MAQLVDYRLDLEGQMVASSRHTGGTVLCP